MEESEARKISHEDLRKICLSNPPIDLSLLIVEGFSFSGIIFPDPEIFAFNSIFSDCSFEGVDLYHSHFGETSVVKGKFRNACLAKAEAYNSDFSISCFDGANMIRFFFKETNLANATFSGANLLGADFLQCNLTNADFSRANLSSVQFIGCDLHGAKGLSGEAKILSYAKWEKN